MIGVANPGHLLITIRKCDDSEPKFGYSFSLNDFQNEDYAN